MGSNRGRRRPSGGCRPDSISLGRQRLSTPIRRTDLVRDNPATTHGEAGPKCQSPQHSLRLPGVPHARDRLRPRSHPGLRRRWRNSRAQPRPTLSTRPPCETRRWMDRQSDLQRVIPMDLPTRADIRHPPRRTVGAPAIRIGTRGQLLGPRYTPAPCLPSRPPDHDCD